MNEKDKKKEHRKEGDFILDLIENSRAGGIFVDERREIKFCNRTVSNLFGYPAKEIVGKRTDVLYGDRRNDKSNKKEIYDILEKKGFHVGFAEGIKRDGEKVELKISTFLVKPNNGAVIFIEKNREMPHPHINRKSFLENLLDNIPDMIYCKDRDGKFLLVNKAHAGALGLEVDDVIGKSDRDFFPEHLAEQYSKDDEDVMGKGEPLVSKITKAVRPDGGNTYVSTTKVPCFDDKGEIIGLIGITRNITEQLVAEEELRLYKEKLEKMVEERTKELENSNEKLRSMYDIKSRFTSNVSHELRTPLTAIRESIDLVMDGSTGEINDEQGSFLSMAKNNVDRLTRLINDVLDFQKLESGKMKFDLQNNDINDAVNEVYQIMKTPAQDKGLELICKTGKDLGNTLLDKDKVIQVVTNLVNNAIKFTEQGTVLIKTFREGYELHVEVTDTGTGIREEDISRLFNEFEQVGEHAGKNTGGSGLGLAISKEIIEKHGGRIWIESAMGEGSTFHFTLPVKSAN